MKSKKTVQKKKFYQKQRFIIPMVILAFIAILLGYDVGVKQYNLYIDQQKFLSAKPIVEHIAKNIRAEMPEYIWRDHAKCITEHKEYDVYTSCGIHVGTEIKVTSANQGKLILDKFSSTIAKQSELEKTKSDNEQYPDFDKYLSQPIEAFGLKLDTYGPSASYIIKDNVLGCGKNTAIESSSPETHSLILSLSLDCSDGALKEWYSPNP